MKDGFRAVSLQRSLSELCRLWPVAHGGKSLESVANFAVEQVAGLVLEQVAGFSRIRKTIRAPYGAPTPASRAAVFFDNRLRGGRCCASAESWTCTAHGL
jgi:hypothetical protein